jgi:hypothetical protein
MFGQGAERASELSWHFPHMPFIEQINGCGVRCCSMVSLSKNDSATQKVRP